MLMSNANRKPLGKMGGLCRGESKIIWYAWSRTNNIHWRDLHSQGEDERFKCESTDRESRLQERMNV
jgi:hypothetical protein